MSEKKSILARLLANENIEVRLTFCDPITKEDEREVEFRLADNSTAKHWVEILHDDIYAHDCTWGNERFSGFGDKESELNEWFNEMQLMYSICQQEYPDYFTLNINQYLCQDFFNEAHVLFEVYRGEIDKPHRLYENGSGAFRFAVERFNELIHLCETYYRSDAFITPRAVVDFYGKHYRTQLTENDYNNFEFMRYDNTLYLSFMNRGKTLIEYYLDDDHHVGDDNIRKYRYLGSNFVISIRGWNQETQQKQWQLFSDWFDSKEEFLTGLGFKKSDAGWLPLAHTEEDLYHTIKTRQFIKDIQVHLGDLYV
jgi:hypothetical protein